MREVYAFTQIGEIKSAKRANLTAFWVGLAGFLVQLASIIAIGGMISFSGGSFMFGPMMGYYPEMMGRYYGGAHNSTSLLMMGTPLIFTVLVIGLGIAGLTQMNSANLEKFRTGSILLLVAALIAFPTAWGFGVGSILMLVGAIVGISMSGLQNRFEANKKNGETIVIDP